MPRKIVVITCLVLATMSAWAQGAAGAWRFAVSGDSRNCGDVVMPTIAASVLQNQVEFYWHLGDFRAMFKVDEDMQQRYAPKLPDQAEQNLTEYKKIAWGDFISNQIAPFGLLPVRLGIGNHETIDKTPADFVAQFGYWLDAPALRAQRLSDSPQDTTIRTYYHWKEHNVDFIYLDNAGDNGFDVDQMKWFKKVVERDKTDKEVRTIVLGMHRALPNSLACGHSMNGDKGIDSKNGIETGRQIYVELLKWRKETDKFVYILASHSHFFMQDLYDTPYWNNPAHGEVLPGWIVGTAGAQRYNLPDLLPETFEKAKPQTDVWGYLLATVQNDGSITFDFTKLDTANVPSEVRKRYGDEFVDTFCFKGNHDKTSHDPPPSCKEQ